MPLVFRHAKSRRTFYAQFESQGFHTAKRLLTNQTFRDIYRADTLDVEQRFKITSLTFLARPNCTSMWATW